MTGLDWDYEGPMLEKIKEHLAERERQAQEFPPTNLDNLVAVQHTMNMDILWILGKLIKERDKKFTAPKENSNDPV